MLIRWWDLSGARRGLAVWPLEGEGGSVEAVVLDETALGLESLL